MALFTTQTRLDNKLKATTQQSAYSNSNAHACQLCQCHHVCLSTAAVSTSMARNCH